MEERVLIKRAIVKDIANAVREKSESSAKFQVSGLGDAIRAIGGTGSAVTELAEAIAGPIAKDDNALANALAAGLTDAPAEQSWNGERRTAGGGSIKDGVAFVDMIKGNSLKMVQLITNGDFSSGLSRWVKYAGATAINAPNVENGKLVVNCIADTTGGDAVAVVHNMANNYITGHIYLILLSFESSNSNLQPLIEGPTSGTYLSRVKGSIWGLRATSAKSGSKSYFKTGPAKQSGDTWSFGNVMVFDLTAMFGSGNEPATADEFIQRLGYASIDELPYIPYTEGEIVSMRASEIKSKGRNLLDMDGSYEVGPYWFWRLPSDTSKRVARISFVDKNPSLAFSNGFGFSYSEHPNDATIGGFYWVATNNKIQGTMLNKTTSGANINAFCSYLFMYPKTEAVLQSFRDKYDVMVEYGDVAHDYVPYREPSTLAFNLSTIKDADGNQLFPDGLCGIGDVRDEIDLARGKAIKRIGVVDMGRLSWDYSSSEACFFCTIDNAADKFFNSICSIYPYGGARSIIPDKAYGYWNSNNPRRLIVKDLSYTTTASFVAVLSGVLLYYELAEPIEVAINPAKAWYRAENGGREELVSDDFTAPLTADIAYRGISAEELINALTD